MDVVYIETTFVSLLVADPSRDLITAANQQATRDWWNQRRPVFNCVTSYEVVREASKGDPDQVQRRLAVLRPIPLIPPNEEAVALTRAFLRTRALPERAESDAAHLAVATVAHADFLITWNCRHIANMQILRRLKLEAKALGWELPIVCTPPELMGE